MRTGWSFVPLAGLICAVACGSPRRAEPYPFSIRYDAEAPGLGGNSVVVEAQGWAWEPEAGSPAFTVWTDRAELSEASCVDRNGDPSILGDVVETDDGFRFVPRVPFQAGSSYQICIHDASKSSGPWTGGFSLPARVGATPRITSILPDVEIVPSNLLRFYIHFSEPMRSKEISSRIELLDDSGAVLRDAFVEIPDGLWDPRGERLTLLLHPGRIKRGVTTPPALVPGHTVSLRIDAEVLSRLGVGTSGTVTRSYRVGEPDRRSPIPQSWRVSAPGHLSAPVILTFDESLDSAQVESLVRVRDAGGQAVEGRGHAAVDGRSWEFHPLRSWHGGRYTIEVDPDIEDLSGNTTRRLFDVDTRGRPQADASVPLAPTRFGEAEAIEFEFEIPPSGAPWADSRPPQ